MKTPELSVKRFPVSEGSIFNSFQLNFGSQPRLIINLKHFYSWNTESMKIFFISPIKPYKILKVRIVKMTKVFGYIS